MSQNICEFLRESVIRDLLKLKTVKKCWPIWEKAILKNITPLNETKVLGLGDSLSSIFELTGKKGRTQSDVSGGGTAWEALVCWYLNLCLIGSRTVVVKHSKKWLPKPVSDAITVTYSNFPSNTESDLIAITFPDRQEYSIDKDLINVLDVEGQLVPTITGKSKKKYNYNKVINSLLEKHLSECEIGIIQCKTNWNDNSQIPMLWDMIYASKGFKNNINVGTEGFSIHQVKKFTYSFVTVPTNNHSNFKETSTPVKRVQNISGGNYWGRASKASVVLSIKEIFNKNFTSGSSTGLRDRLRNELQFLGNKYEYFSVH
ncbi:hypothetical protein JJB07_11505 [Tumebacillus sp. ITR2]|uniref:Uncharacterized protein n=1 Tax=Tumebacillus amylolyticus TaxID=2801339 RepID=A0ABS1JAG1_9BACL|nr:hypothetical protein [Tumebacillus amylolyticus]MBL0387277.1 hypothetical protein [Tumebacillus amylolyticus]